jgi:hypothetical protein
MWRLTGIELREGSRAMFEVRKKFVGHVIGDTPNKEISGTLTIVQELHSAIKIPLDIANRRYLTVHDPIGDYRSDALTAGQMSVTLSRFTNRPVEEAPLIAEVHGKGSIE